MNEEATTHDNNKGGLKNRFDGLIFVTSPEKLAKNIGEAETGKVIAYLKSIAAATLVELPVLDNATEAAKLVRSHIQPHTKGIVIVGGYDVVPSLQLNVLSDALLKEIENDPESQNEDWDVDDFIVWSDDIYGDKEGNILPDLPVSRVPDGKNPSLVLNALIAPLPRVDDKYGVRNIKRPFAEDVFATVPFKNNQLLEVSEACSPKMVKASSVKGALYFMLHGHDHDATRFTGELGKKSGYYEAFDIYNVPANCQETVVFTGCCYGALIALPKADRKEPGMPVRSRTHEQSIALAFLNAGVNAFVGCTAAHYSPRIQNGNFFGKPMHISFWNGIKNGKPPALALFEAKQEYATEIPHKLTKAIYKAIEVKMLHQFTCLGIGW